MDHHLYVIRCDLYLGIIGYSMTGYEPTDTRHNYDLMTGAVSLIGVRLYIMCRRQFAPMTNDNKHISDLKPYQIAFYLLHNCFFIPVSPRLKPISSNMLRSWDDFNCYSSYQRIEYWYNMIRVSIQRPRFFNGQQIIARISCRYKLCLLLREQDDSWIETFSIYALSLPIYGHQAPGF